MTSLRFQKIRRGVWVDSSMVNVLAAASVRAGVQIFQKSHKPIIAASEGRGGGFQSTLANEASHVRELKA